MNTHTIHGRLTRDPEYIKGSDESKDRIKFNVAVSRSYGDETDFIDCIVFGKRAKIIHKYFHKGKEILIQGEGRINSYTDKDGVKRKSYTIVVGDFDFCGNASEDKSRTYDSWEELEADNPFAK